MGKYLKEFELTSQYEEYINSTMALLPNVSLTNDDNIVHYNPKPDLDTKNYLTIEALEDGLTVKLSRNACEYCIDGDNNWVSLAAGTSSPSLNAGQTISFRGNLIPKTNYGIGKFTISKKCNVLGNIMSMLFGDDGKDKLSLSGKDWAFCDLFGSCTTIISAKNLILPATTSTQYCYYNMFQGCTSLTTAPTILPATTLAQGCYSNMFNDCKLLTAAPELPAINLASLCYYFMFNGCTSLTTAPELPATTLAEYCYQAMFMECKSLTAAPELPATTLAKDCYSSMFSGCRSLTTAPAILPATTLADDCYRYMFMECKSLTAAPELPATTLATGCYSQMFDTCTSLTTAPALPATTLASNCYQNMFYGCTSLTTAPELPATTLANSCYTGMFNGCTSLTTAPELPATTLTRYCYEIMFKGCTKLNYIKMLATDISATDCLKNWVQNVASTGTFVKHPNMTSLPTGVNGIPSGWTVEDAV